ncbi:uncharacterized protein LOC143252203 isoform X3 [Tachypleus tridentatus]|uniref:uncharacterized protein LOC143252203 isoform X3 n=1 Tax=Tachypleus tridentatus TaxID=6853 RepID=UPI003FCFACE7
MHRIVLYKYSLSGPENLTNFCRYKMSSPKKEDLPKVSPAIKVELTNFDSTKMRHTETREAVSLPSKNDVEQEKAHNTLLQNVEGFQRSSLHHTQPQEKIHLPSAEEIEQEKGQQQLLEGIKGFDTTKMKHAETEVKNPLPTKDVIDQEKASN